VPHACEPVIATVGHAQRPFTCHVCTGAVFTGFRTNLDDVVSVRSTWQLSEYAINLACETCRYVHTFRPGAIQVWPAAEGYSAGGH
jgi:hypothetical protein